MKEMKMIRTNFEKINKELEIMRYNYSVARDEKGKEICLSNIAKKESEGDEILAILDDADSSILNLEKYVNYGMDVKDNILRLWRIASLGNKKRIQNMMFMNGIIYNKENDDIEPLSRNEFMFLFDLLSTDCENKKEKTNHQNDDLSPLVLEAGLEPAQPSLAKGF